MKKTVIGMVSSIIILILCQLISQLLGSLIIIIHLPDFVGNIIAAISYVASVYICLNILAKKYLKINSEELGMPKFKIKCKWAVIAMILPVVVTGCYMMFSGQLYHNEKIATATIVSAGVFYIGIAAGFVEEMVFRGVIFHILIKKTNKYIAIIGPSILFGALHLIGGDFSVGSAILVTIAGTFVGIMFSLIALESKSVWNSGIVHALWNIIMAGGIFQVSTKIDNDAIYNYVVHTKSVYFTGGEFGIESSVISIVGYLFVSAIAFMGIKFQEKAFVSK